MRGRCADHPIIPNRRRGYSEDKRFYNSAHWQRVRGIKLNQDPLCQYCLVTEKLSTATEVDHYTPIERGGHKTDSSNLVSACKPCHSRKTQLEQQGRPPPPYVPSSQPAYDFA